MEQQHTISVLLGFRYFPTTPENRMEDWEDKAIASQEE